VPARPALGPAQNQAKPAGEFRQFLSVDNSSMRIQNKYMRIWAVKLRNAGRNWRFFIFGA